MSTSTVKLSLFSPTAFVPPNEREEYEDFCADYLRELAPKTAVEDTLADEIIQAAWRLRRCAAIEQQEIPADIDPEQLERIQTSIDRARATAQRVYHKSLTELRRVRAEAKAAKEATWKKETDDAFQRAMQLGRESYAEATKRSQLPAAPESSISDTRIPSASVSAKQSQIPRNALCPCNSGEKYKRCCGKNAPPVLSTAA